MRRAARRPRGRARRPPAGRLAVLVLFLLAGCFRGSTSEKPPIHLNPNMDHQPKYRPQEKSDFFYDGAAMRTPVPGTRARGSLAEDPAVRTGRDATGKPLVELPVAVDAALIERGRERFGIYCTPCHGERGDGNGMLRERGKIQVANLLEPRFRTMPVGEIFDTVSHGKGLMPAYGYPIPVRDRWAIIAYVRRLQEEAGAP